MKDQLEHWNNAHKNQWLHAHSQKQTDFAEEVNRAIPAGSSVLELGCGEGNDSIYLAGAGHAVVATDFSDVVIKQNRQRYSRPHLQFEVQDIGVPLKFEAGSFDVVYARLSLHYFPDKTTREIFKEIKRVLKPGGSLHFMCKATGDTIYGQGEKLEPDMYELDVHVRHFFSEAYVHTLLDETGLDLESLGLGEEMVYDRRSAFVKVAAIKS
jgi:ubiquinone/menaquinone biosynthesis C-methylase UbiE